MKALTILILTLLIGCASTGTDPLAEQTPAYTIDDIRLRSVNYHAQKIAYQLAEQLTISAESRIRVSPFQLSGENVARFNQGFSQALKRALHSEGFAMLGHRLAAAPIKDSEQMELPPLNQFVVTGDISLSEDSVVITALLVCSSTENVYASHSHMIPFKPQYRQGLVFQAHRSYVRGPTGSDEI